MSYAKPRPTGWGLIGASRIAASQVIPAIRAQAGHEIVAVASSKAEHAGRYADEHRIASAYDDVAALLADPAVDIVYISSTNEKHAAQTIAAAAAGKHVLCEKPLAMTLVEARQMVAACAKAGVVLATNHHLRNAASHRRIRELIEQGAIGKPLFARVFHAVYLPTQLQGWRIDAPDAGGGVILDIAVHDVDLLRFTLGAEPVAATGMAQSATLAQAGIEDGAMAVLRFDSGLLAQIHVAFTVAYAGDGIEYHGDQGSIVARDVLTVRPPGSIVLRNAQGEQVIEVGHNPVHVEGVARFCAAIRGQGSPAASGEDGLKSLAAALAIAQACRTGQTQAILN
jgi:1,5-anhydro-D-fructose reductase (1,5-anhydro-D-mannitol-forming)